MLSIIALAMAVAGSGNAQAEHRIQFPKGKSATVVKGATGTSGVTYVLRARSGQKIVLDLTRAKGLGIKVETNGRFGQMVLLREESGGHFEVGLEETGDYTIFIGSMSGKSTPFVLRVAVTRLADI